MGYERLAWVGNLVLAGIGIYLSWWPVSHEMSKWVTIGIAVLVVAAAVAMFPRRRSDGSTARLIHTFRPRVSGNHNPTMIAGERSNQIVNEGGGTFNINREKDS